MQSTSSKSSLIWSTVVDNLRGLFKTSEYGRVILVILPFEVIRFLYCVLESNKDKVYNLYQQFKDQFNDPSPVILPQIGLSFFNVSKFDLSRITSEQVQLSANLST